jgi:hypothetical protein
MSVEGALYALVDQPDLMHGVVGRLTLLHLRGPAIFRCAGKRGSLTCGKWSRNNPSPGRQSRKGHNA